MADRPTPRPGGESPGDGIEVTAEMLSAGSRALERHYLSPENGYDLTGPTLAEIYREMHKARMKRAPKS